MGRLVILGLCFAALLVTRSVHSAPDFPTLSGRVVDQAGILSAETESQLTEKLLQHENSTSNQVVVVTLTSLQGNEIADYGYQLGREWGIGQQGRDNGVLLIVAPSERKVRIEVGYGLEGTLTDALAKNIIETVITPRFKQGDMEAGIREGTLAILAAIEGTYTPQERSGADIGEAFNFFGAAVILSMIFGGGVRYYIGNRVIASAVMGGIALLIGYLLISIAVGVLAGIAVFLIGLLSGAGGGGGNGGYHRGGYYGGGSHTSGGGFSGGFSGGGGSFGGGGASGGW